ncbi:MAG: hypothetical protein U9R08_04685 [Nanoarchaeota archaeon]|nr:hypothetical protein [Nanoarchaeota archaeon]
MNPTNKALILLTLAATLVGGSYAKAADVKQVNNQKSSQVTNLTELTDMKSKFRLIGRVEEIGPDVYLANSKEYDEFTTYKVKFGNNYVWALADGIGFPDVKVGSVIAVDAIPKVKYDNFGMVRLEDESKYQIKNPFVIMPPEILKK